MLRSLWKPWRRFFYRSVHTLLPASVRRAGRRAIRGPYPAPEEAEAAKAARHAELERARAARLKEKEARRVEKEQARAAKEPRRLEKMEREAEKERLREERRRSP